MCESVVCVSKRMIMSVRGDPDASEISNCSFMFSNFSAVSVRMFVVSIEIVLCFVSCWVIRSLFLCLWLPLYSMYQSSLICSSSELLSVSFSLSSCVCFRLCLMFGMLVFCESVAVRAA